MSNNSDLYYKVFNPDWTCRGFSYKVGESYKIKGDLEICKNGFHACKKVSDCFNYYRFDPCNKVALVRLSGVIKTDGDKTASSTIEIIKELSWSEVLDLANSGHSNSGLNNSGDRNSGNRNSGDWNSGDINSGNWNSGNRNSGDRNSGDWNSGHWNSGFFNTSDSEVRIFNKKTKIKRSEINFPSCFYFDLNVWVDESDMSKSEKDTHPSYKTNGGYLKTLDYKEAWANALSGISEEEKQMILDLPNYDPDIFEEITGVRIER